MLSKYYFIKSTALYYLCNLPLYFILGFSGQKYKIIALSFVIGLINIPLHITARRKLNVLYNKYLTNAITWMLMSLNLLIMSFTFEKIFSVFAILKILIWICIPIAVMYFGRNKTPDKNPPSIRILILTASLGLFLARVSERIFSWSLEFQFSYECAIGFIVTSFGASVQFWVWRKDLDNANKI